MELCYKPPFRKFVKKQTRPLQLAIEDAVEEIAAHPEVGELKKGDLAGFRVYRHEDVFDAIRQAPFTLKEAAEYLEVAEITVRRWVNAGKLSAQKIGRNLLFDPDVLKQMKKTFCASLS